MELSIQKDSLIIRYQGKTLLTHSIGDPMFFLGKGQETVDMYRGNFKIEDYLEERFPLRQFCCEKNTEGYVITFEQILKVEILLRDDVCLMKFSCADPAWNRFWMRLPADAEEKCYGCGEQMSYFNLRGRLFPIWTSEPGVGRDKTTYVTWRSDVENRGGGDYYNSNFPAPMFVSSKHYWLMSDSTAYAVFDYTHENFHELQLWNIPGQIRIQTGSSYLDLAQKISAYLGRQPELPEWVYDGAILGLQGGTQRVCDLLQQAEDNGVLVSAIWSQDWEGKRVTSFGSRLKWDWLWNKEMYPGLPEHMKEWKDKGIHFLGYINPYLVDDGTLFQEGAEKGYFATKADGSIYLVDFGEFNCGVVDFTNPEAYTWFKEIIKKNLIAFGLDGWMADFGEYLPTDLMLNDGSDPMIAHNRWPVLWAKCNYDALVETGNLGKILVFMRSGGIGTQKYCPLLWAGDQSVDFSIHDGLASVIVGALSAAMSGCGLHHSDIGGYTSLFGNCRTKELFLRWAEMAAFTPVMRTHEGNRPGENFQYYDDADATRAFGRLTRIYKMLSPYIRDAVAENSRNGIPVQRPLLLHYEEDIHTAGIQTEYLLGRDLLVAPVYQEKKTTWEVYLPEDQWVHLWSGKSYTCGNVTVDAPIGYPPVFYRADSDYARLFEQIGRE